MLFAVKPQGADRSPRGQGLVEYALILVLIAIVVIAALIVLGPTIRDAFFTINSTIAGI